MTPPPSLQDLIDTVRRDAATDDSLGMLVVAATTAAELEETTDALLGYFVDRCRREGRSWSEISSALGVTKQAVHKRFASAVAAHLVAASPSPTFERFTDRARHVVAAASQAAVAAGQENVGAEYVLIGLFSEPEGLAGRALAAMNVSEQSVQAAIREATASAQVSAAPAPTALAGAASAPTTLAGVASAPTAPAGSAAAAAEATPGSRPPFSGDAKRALGDALAVALELGHNYIGTEHILLGLYRNEESLAARVLAAAGAPQTVARAHITEMLRGLSTAGR